MSHFTAQPETSSVLTSSIVPLDRIVTNAGQAAPPPVVVTAEPIPAKGQERLLSETEPRGLIEVEGKTQAMTIDAPPAPTVAETSPPPPAPAVQPRSPTRLTTVEDLGSGSPWINHDFGPQPNVLAYAPVQKRGAATSAASPGTGPAENRGPGIAKVTLDVNVRSAPDNEAPVVLVAKPGTTLNIEKCLFWCTVEVGGQRGYIYRKFVGR